MADDGAIEHGDIDQVITDLEAIVADCRARSDRAGYFAAMYLVVTKEIKVAVDAGRFEDGPRMARLDHVFAQRYIDAFHANRAGQAVTKSWEVAFAGATRRRPIIVQQLLAGMNAHINLDLGIAAATVSPGDEIESLKADFDTINAVLASMTEQFTTDVGDLSPWIGLLDRIGGRAEQHVIRFSIDVARDEAWKLATELAPLPRSHWSAVIVRRDRVAADLGKLTLHPGILLSAGLAIIRSRESNSVQKVIDGLGNVAVSTA